MTSVQDPHSHPESHSRSDPDLPIVRSRWLDRLVFLGTGTSGQVPAIHCITSEGAPHEGADGAGASARNEGCETCVDAMRVGSRNRRGCTCVALIGGGGGSAGAGRRAEKSTILIDCGKTFYSSAITHFPLNGIRRITAVLLTHAHADAILGLDDLRSWTMGGCIQSYVDVYLTKECMETVGNMFPYLVDRGKSTGGGDVGSLQWHIIDPAVPFWVGTGEDAVRVIPLPVHHGFHGRGGPPFWSLGFRIDSLSYVSDCHHIPASTTDLIAGSDLIVMDALKFDRHASHFSLPQALSYLLSLPTTTSQSSQSRTPLPLALLTDFTHRIEHHSTEAMIQRWANGLRAWLSNRPGAGIQKTIAANGNANASARKGEAGGPRWWDGVWDEDRSETELKLELEEQNSPIAGEGKGEAALSNGSNGSATLNGVHGSGSSAEPHVPEIHMAWDGMVVRFSREVE